MKIPQKVHLKKKICPWKFLQYFTFENEIHASETLRKSYPLNCKNAQKKTKSPPVKPNFQSVKQMKKSAPEKKSAGKKSQQIGKLHSWNTKCAPDRNRQNVQKGISRVLFIFTGKKKTENMSQIPQPKFQDWKSAMKFHEKFHEI